MMNNTIGKSPVIITKGLSNKKIGKDQEIDAINVNTIKDLIEPESPYDPKTLLKEILRGEERTEQEIWMLYDAFKEMKFFRQFIISSDEKERMKALLYVFKKIKYERVGAQRCIIRQGEFSDGKVYIVLSGELKVLINKDPKKVKALIEKTEEADTEDKEKEDTESPATPSTVVSIASPTLLQSPPVTVAQNTLKYTHRPRSSRRKTQSPELGNRTPVLSHSPTLRVESPAPQSKLKKENPTSKIKKKNKIRTEPIFVAQEELKAYGIMVGQLEKGDHFGERALFNNHQRSASIITNSLVELLVLDRETFRHVMVGFQKAKSQILDYLSVTLPNLDKVLTKQVLEGLMYVADVRDFAFRTNLGIEGEPADQLYLIYEGQCELIKTVIYDNSENVSLATEELKSLYGLKKTKKEDLVILNLERGSFIGEEICFDDKVMLNCTIRVSSERAKIICFPKNLFLFRCPKMIIKGITKIFAEKKERFTQSLLQKLGKKGVEADYKTLLGIKPVVPITPKNNFVGLNLNNLNSGFEAMEPLEALEQKISPRSRRIMSSTTRNKTTTTTISTTTDLLVSPPLTRNSSHKALTTPKMKITNFKKLNLDDLENETLVSPKSRPLLSARVSPKNEKLVVVQPKTFMTSMNEVDEKIPSKKDESFINNVHNFKINFGKPSKEVERRYKALVHKYTGGTPIKKKRNNSSIFESSINLADFITRKLRENNFDSIQDEKVVTGGRFESTLESMVELPRSSNNLDLLKSACVSPTNSLHLSKSQSKPKPNNNNNLGSFEELTSQRISKTPRVQSASSNGFRMPQTARHERQHSHYNLIGSFNSENFNQLLAGFSPNINNKFIPRHVRAKTQILPKDFVNIHVANRNVYSLKRPIV